MRAPRPPEEFFLKFHLREQMQGKERSRRRQELLVRLIQLISLLLEESGFELMLSDGRGKLYRADVYLERMLRQPLGQGESDALHERVPSE